MRLLDSIDFQACGENKWRRIELVRGDLSAIPAEDPVDLLVVPARPDDYTPTPNSLIGALLRNRGISVAKLAENKEIDLRPILSCWLAGPFSVKETGFHRIICFEPPEPRNAASTVAELFRYIVDLSYTTKIAMPILASGDPKEGKTAMLEAVVKAAAAWLFPTLPDLQCLRIAIYPGTPEETELREAFAQLKATLRAQTEPLSSTAKPTLSAMRKLKKAYLHRPRWRLREDGDLEYSGLQFGAGIQATSQGLYAYLHVACLGIKHLQIDPRYAEDPVALVDSFMLESLEDIYAKAHSPKS